VRFVVAYVVAAFVFLGVDAIWLTQIALRLYRRELGALLLDTPNIAVASVFYAIFIAGIVLLAVLPGLDAGSWSKALWMGASLGLVAYGTYDLTNLSTLRGWSLTVTAADLAWGTALGAVASVAAYFSITAFALR
jgi:uncharacterized membrane protein